MLDGLLGRSGFSSKCKSLIKQTRTRIEVLRRRAEAKQRFLKEDLAKLLANGLDVNAYGRTEDFIAGLNLLSCYTFIDQSCEYILKQLSVMQKLGQCPEECRETVASLMFAAARFSDLPELRDLRDVFQERYGNGLECYVNQVFVEKLASKPPVVEKRIKLLQDVAAEFTIQWDSKGFKQRMDSPSTLAQDQVRKFVPPNATDNKYKVPNGKERIQHTPHEGPQIPLHNNGNGNFRKQVLQIPSVAREEKHSKERIKHEIPFVAREEKHGHKHEGYLFKTRPESDSDYNGIRNNHIPSTIGTSYLDRRPEVSQVPYVGREEKHGHKHDGYSSKTRPESDSDNGIRNRDFPSTIGTSYLDRRPEVSQVPFLGREERQGYKHESYLSKTRPESDSDNSGIRNNRIPSKIGTSYLDRRPEVSPIPLLGREEKHGQKHEGFLSKTRPESDSDNHGIRNNHIPSRIGTSYRSEVKDDDVKSTGKVQEEEKEPINLLKLSYIPPPYIKSNIPPPYTKPTTHLHQPPSTDDLPPPSSGRRMKDQNNDIPLPKPRSVRRKHSKSSSSHDDIGSSEDSRIVKRMYSSRRKERKGLEILFDDEHYEHKDEEEKMMDKLLLHYSKKPSSYDGKLRKKKSSKSRSPVNDGEVEKEINVPVRSISLPHESEVQVPKKVYARANSFQPDNQAPHVHPKLPDYDDLAARFAALRGR